MNTLDPDYHEPGDVAAPHAATNATLQAKLAQMEARLLALEDARRFPKRRTGSGAAAAGQTKTKASAPRDKESIWDREQAGDPVARLGIQAAAILARRREERARRKKAGLSLVSKDWSREEFCETYGSCKELLEGHLKGLPPRSMVMEIAEYFECTLMERNSLLAAAGYHEERTYLEGEELAAGLELAHEVIHYLPLPAFVATQKWEIRDWNPRLMTLFDFSQEDADRIPTDHLHMLRLIFDQRFPFYERLGGKKSPDTWRATALLNIYWFKVNNVQSQYDAWYKELVQKLWNLEHFPELWNQVDVDSALGLDPRGDAVFPQYRTMVIRTDGKMLWITGLQISLGNFDYPTVIAYIPDGPESRRTFDELGLPTWSTLSEHP